MSGVLLSGIGWALFVLAVLAGLALDLVGLFGNWVILGAVVVAWAVTGLQHFGGWAIAGLIALAVLGEVIEAVAAGYGASRFGGSKGSILAALVGCLVGAVVGTPWFPIVGTVIGACVGAFAAAAGYESLIMRKEAGAALWTGAGAAIGKVAGMSAKLLVGGAMLCVAALTY